MFFAATTTICTYRKYVTLFYFIFTKSCIIGIILQLALGPILKVSPDSSNNKALFSTVPSWSKSQTMPLYFLPPQVPAYHCSTHEVPVSLPREPSAVRWGKGLRALILSQDRTWHRQRQHACPLAWSLAKSSKSRKGAMQGCLLPGTKRGTQSCPVIEALDMLSKEKRQNLTHLNGQILCKWAIEQWWACHFDQPHTNDHSLRKGRCYFWETVPQICMAKRQCMHFTQSPWRYREWRARYLKKPPPALWGSLASLALVTETLDPPLVTNQPGFFCLIWMKYKIGIW